MSDFLITSQRLGLRRFKASDAEDFSELLTDDEVCYFEPYDTYTLEEALTKAEELDGDERFYAVILKSTGKLIGKVYFEDKMFFGAFEIGYSFNRRFWDKGYAAEAVRAVMDNAFGVMNVRRIIAEADVRNTRSIKLLERVGMRREGVYLKSAYFQKDENGDPVWSDYATYALLKEEWEQSRS